MAACHSAASCSALGSAVMYLAASRNARSVRLSGRMIGSSNGADHGTNRHPLTHLSGMGRGLHGGCSPP
jgi:hypothetical protein